MSRVAIIDKPAAVFPVPEPPERRPRSRRRRPVHLRRRLLVCDATTVAVGWTAHLLVLPGTVALADGLLFVVATTTATLVALAAQRLYRARVATVRADEVARLARVAVLSTAAALLAGRWLGIGAHGRSLALAAVAVYAGLVVVRGRYGAWLRDQRAMGRYCRPVVVVGDDQEADELVALLLECPEVGFRPVGLVRRERREPGHGVVPWLGEPGEVVEIVRETGATGAIIAAGSMAARDRNDIVRRLHAAGIHVHLSSGITGVHHRRMRVQPIAHEPLIYVESAALSGAQLFAKRCLDLLVASGLLVAAAPVAAAAAFAVKLSDGGPVLFRQQRVGRDGELFTVTKFRSMAVDAELRLDELQAANEREGPLFKLRDDPRVTRVGRLLRATSIDEIPQLLSVLRGTMSMVGPRPALPSEVAAFDDELLDRLRVKPGVSGLWQVEGREKPSFTSYRRLDLFYVENWSLGLDVAILLVTVPAVAGRAWRSLRRRLADHARGPVPLMIGQDGRGMEIDVERTPAPGEVA